MAIRDDFDSKLEWGQLGEGEIAKWLRARGWSILPVYEKEIHNGKGPRLFLPKSAQLVAPDMLAFKANGALWIEAKTKTVFSWHRVTQKWVTGIDLHHYQQYLQVADVSPWPVWLLFLHKESSEPSRQEPWPCPTGLYGGLISNLAKSENHRHENWGKTGMVYWAEQTLKKIADYPLGN